MVDPTGTRHRANLRSRESVAHWRLKSGAWGARVYAAVLAVPALGAVLWTGPATGFTIAWSLALALIMLAISFRIAQGRRWAAVAVLVAFVLDKVIAILIGGISTIFNGLVVSLIIGFTLTQGVWGAYALRSVER